MSSSLPAHDADLEQSLLRALVDATEIGVAFFDRDGRCVSANDAYAAMHGCTATELRQRPVEDVSPAVAPELRSAIANVVATRRTVEFEFSGVRHAGQVEVRHWVSVLHPIVRDGDVRFVGEMVRDVTARRVVEIARGAELDLERTSREEAQRQRDFLRLVLENAPMGLSVCEGPEHRLVAVSDFALRLLNVPREAILGRPVAESFPAAFAVARDMYDRVYHTGETVVVPELAVPLPDGRTIWVYVCYALMRRSDGSPLGVMALSLDITEQHRTQATIDAQKGVFEALASGEELPAVLEKIVNVVAEHSADQALPSILLLDSEGRLRHGAAPHLPDAYNAAIDGLRIGPVAGSCGTAAFRRARVVVTDTQADPLWSDFRELAAEFQLRACWSTPILGSAGRVLGTFAVYYREPMPPSESDLRLVDLLVRTTAFAIEWTRADDERRRILEAERVARKEAEAASRSKDEFVATLSHELRTPLNAILGWSRLLRAGQLAPDAVTHALEAIERNTRAQTQLVEDLLDISRIITGKLRLDVRSVDLMSVVNAAIDTVRPAADAKGLRLQAVLDPRAAPIVGDPDRLQQVVWNLLSNAVKFTPKGGRVQVRVERINSHVEIIVSDTGIGITEDLLPFVFERFRQGPRTAGRGGLGIGLAIARHLVELHGGTVDASSAGSGLGATFRVSLPLAAVQAARPPQDAHPTAQPGVLPADLPALPRVRVLVVDDDDEGREVVSTVLVTAGAEVRSASGAAEALAYVVEWRPHIIISDIEMQEQDGYTFIQNVRRLPGGSATEIPAVALTAYARVEDRIKALASGFQMHVPKPVEPAELIAVVGSLFKGRTRTD